MPAGVLFALFSYAIYACSDSLVKSVGTSLSVYEISFFSALFSVLPAIVSKPADEHWSRLWQMRHPYLVQLRAVSGVLGTTGVVYALTNISLADTYSLVFLTPVFVVVLSVAILREHVAWQRWLLLATSFIGVLMVVRPGFRVLQLGHLAALLCAVCGAATAVLLRHVAEREKRVSLIGVVAAYSLVFNGVLMAPSFIPPTATQFVAMAGVGLLGGTGHIFYIAAMRASAANQVAPVQYTQMVWGVVFGAVIYREIPDTLASAGLLVILVAGIGNVLLRAERPALGPLPLRAGAVAK